MSTNDQDSASENEPSSNPQDRLDEIKKEAEEDASSYYTQGESEDTESAEDEFKKPVPKVNQDKEEMSLLKAIAFLGFGMAALAIIFILFFIRDLGHRVGGMDSEVKTLQEEYGPLKKQVTENFAQVNKDVSLLKTKFGGYERQAAITELKRALVAIQGVTANTPEVQAKSGQLIASIETLLKELDGGSAAVSSQPMAPAAPAPAAPAATMTPPPVEEPPAEEMTAEVESEPAMEEEEPAEEKSPVGEISLQTESSASDDEDSGGEEGSDDEEEEEEE